MGAMMWFMARGKNRPQRTSIDATTQSPAQPASLELLREEHARLSHELERLEQREADAADTSQRR